MSSHEMKPCVDPGLGAKLLSYGLGTLHESDRQAFEEHLLNCPACQAEVRAAGRVLSAMAVKRGELIARLNDSKRASTGESSEDSAPARLGARSAFLWSALAAAAVVIGILYVGRGIPYRTGDSHSNYGSKDSESTLQSLPSDPEIAAVTRDSTHAEAKREQPDYASLATRLPLAYLSVRTRGAASVSREEFELAMQAYLGRDYEGAVEQLGDLSRRDSTSSEILLYLGISRYMSGDSRSAIRDFDRAEVLKPRTTRFAQIRWYRANALLREGEVGRVRNDLELVRQSGTELSDEAAELLRRLEEAAAQK